MEQDIITRILNKRAKEAGYYTEADIIRFQNEEADDIILENLPVGIPLPHFTSYLDKINYIAASGYGIY